jgi:L-amino acid N-acyltransferase YncA
MREAEAIIAICRFQFAGAYEGCFVVACNTRAVDGAHHLTHLSFDIHAYSADQRRPWFAEHSAGDRHRLLVAEDEQHGVIAYAASGRFRAKEAYETTVEVSIQCRPSFKGGGLGGRLYDDLFTLLAVGDVHCAVAGIAMPNPRVVKKLVAARVL